MPAVKSRRVTVTTTATVISSEVAGAGNAQSILVRNADASASVDIGDSTVVAGAGFELVAGAAVTVDTFGEPIYARVASGTVVVHVLETGL